MKTLLRNTFWVIFCLSSIIILVVAIITTQMMATSAKTIEETSKEHILALSRGAALLATADELDQFMTPEDMESEEYQRLNERLQVFNDISGTEYTYFLRLDKDSNMMQFIIDNSVETTALSEPLVPREDAPDIALKGIANTVEFGSYSEGWEGYLTAFAPVYYEDGRLSNIVAGVDMKDIHIRENNQNMNNLSVLLILSILVALGACLFSLILYQRKAKQALLASEAKSSFLSNMSHEIRTPMNAILGMVDIIIQEENSSAVRSHASDIRNACQGLLTVINDVLDISKIESGKMEIIPAKYYISSLIADTISIIKIRLDDTGIDFVIEKDSNIPSELIGDEMRIKQVLINLLNNAAKFTHEGQITLSVRSHIENDICHLDFSVTDTGIGIKDEDLQKIFVLFQQVDTKKNRNIEGTGLGLSISKQLIEMMDGTITVKSKYGVGSTFTASIPQPIANHQPMAELEYLENAHNENNPLSIELIAPDAKVLVVDDNEINLRVAAGLLKIFKIEASTAFSGKQALKMVKETDYDLVFMDHMMPEMDGIEATKAIRDFGGKYKELPIIALTANAIGGVNEMFKENGLNDFLAKPIELKKLNATLKKWLPLDKQLEYEKIVAIEDDSLDIPGLNTRKGITNSGGSLDAYNEILAVYVSDGEKRLAEMKKYYEENQLKNLTIWAHAIKSASANIGGEQFSIKAAELELAGKTDDNDFIDNNIHDFFNALSTLLASIREYLASLSGKIITPDKPADSNLLKSSLSEIEQHMSNLDINSAENLLDELCTYQWNEDIFAWIYKMKDCINIFDYDGLEAAMAQLRILNEKE